MTKYQKITGAVLLGLIFGLSAFDFWIGLSGGGEATISWMVFSLGKRYQAIPFGMGFLMGHFFAQMSKS